LIKKNKLRYKSCTAVTTYYWRVYCLVRFASPASRGLLILHINLADYGRRVTVDVWNRRQGPSVDIDQRDAGPGREALTTHWWVTTSA